MHKYVGATICKEHCGYHVVGWDGNNICPRCGADVSPFSKIKLIWVPNPKPFRWWNPSSWERGKWVPENEIDNV